MSEKRMSLRSWGYVLLFFVTIDVVQHVITRIAEITSGEIEMELASLSPSEQSIFVVFYSILLGLFVLSISAQAFLGIRAFTFSARPSAARFHIGLAKFCAVISAILALVSIAILFETTEPVSDTLSLLLCLCDVAIFSFYAKDAKAVRQEFLDTNKAE